jgi:hypothetical protein
LLVCLLIEHDERPIKYQRGVKFVMRTNYKYIC